MKTTLKIAFDLRDTPVFPVAGNVYGLKLIPKPSHGTEITTGDINQVNLRRSQLKGDIYSGEVVSSISELMSFHTWINSEIIYNNKGYKIIGLSLISPIPLPQKCFWLNVFRHLDLFTCSVCLFTPSDDYKKYTMSEENIIAFNESLKQDDFKSWILLQVLDCGIENVTLEFEIESFDK